MSKLVYWAPEKPFVKIVLTRTRKKRVWQAAIYGQQETRIQSSLALLTHSHQTLPPNQDYLRLFALVLNNYSDKLVQPGMSTTAKPRV